MHPVRIIVAVVALGVVGCTNLPERGKVAGKAGGPQRVDWNGFALGEAGKGTISAQAFAERVGVLLKADRSLSARLYVERYPDVALTALRTAPDGMPPHYLAFVERVHDAQCAPGLGNAWAERRRLAARLSDVSLEADGVLKLCKATQSQAGALDANRLAGQTHLKANRPQEAAAAFGAGLAAAQTSPYEAVDYHLLHAEALRRSGQAAPAAAEWIAAVTVAAGLLDRPPRVADPWMWERLASNRPIEATWPAGVKMELMNAAAAVGLPLPDAIGEEGALWAAVGCWHLDRNELDAALKSFKRAETVTADLITRNLLQVWQAKALALLNQVPTATALLVPLVNHPSPLVLGPATANLAALKLQAGAARQARTLLEQALKLPSAWAGMIDAEADLAIALILDGEHAQGLAKLQAAQSRFSTAGDLAGLLRCLRNEADYWTAKDDLPRADAIKKRMQAIETHGVDPRAAGQAVDRPGHFIQLP